MPDTGAPWEIPYLDGTELVRAYPAFSEDLADAIADGLDAAAPDTIVRTGTDTTEIRVDDDGQINVADATSPTPVVRPLPFAIDTGQSGPHFLGGGTATFVTVTFPSGRFTSAPRVMVTPNDPGRNYPVVYTSSITSTGCSVYLANLSTLNGNFFFQHFAIQLTA